MPKLVNSPLNGHSKNCARVENVEFRAGKPKAYANAISSRLIIIEQFKELKKKAIDISSIPGILCMKPIFLTCFIELTVVPNSIDVLDFAKARATEMNMLKKDIDDAKTRGARRVFQTLPKSMRRRAASFNIKRLPTRLRMKAIMEASYTQTCLYVIFRWRRIRLQCRKSQRNRHAVDESDAQRTFNKWPKSDRLISAGLRRTFGMPRGARW